MCRWSPENLALQRRVKAPLTICDFMSLRPRIGCPSVIATTWPTFHGHPHSQETWSSSSFTIRKSISAINVQTIGISSVRVVEHRWSVSRHRVQTPDNHVAPIRHPSNQQGSTNGRQWWLHWTSPLQMLRKSYGVKISMSLHLEALATRRSEDISSCQAGQ